MGRKSRFDNGASFNGANTHKDKVELQNSVFSTTTQSTIEARASRSKSFSEGAITRHQRDAKASTNSSEGTPLTCQSSIRRVLSLEPALPLHKEILKVPYTDKHLMSESSSNSSHAISLNHSESKNKGEISVETKSCKEGMMTGVLPKASGCSSVIDEKSNETVRLDSVGSVSLKKDEFSKEVVVQLKSSGGQASSDASQLSEQLCSKKMKRAESVGPEAGHESKEAAHQEQQLPKLRATSGQGTNFCGFDLNEDLDIYETGETKHPIDESVSSHTVASVSDPIAVVAKIGVPNGLPTAPLRFDGELGWRRSAATSAFRPALPSRNSTDSNTTPSPGLRGFDLNVAVSMDGSAMDSDYAAPPLEPHAARSYVETSSKKSERLTLNLSCRGENCRGQPKSQNQSLDLNDSLIDQDMCGGLHHPDQSSYPKKNCVPPETIKGSARQSNFHGVRPAYWVDLSSMPGFTHVQGQPFIVAAPMFSSAEQKQTLVPVQPTVAFTPAPPSGYYIGTTNGLTSSIYSPSILPHAGLQNGVGTIPQISGPVLTAYPGSLHLLETATTQGLSPVGYTNMRPSFFLNGGVGSLENVNKVAANASVEERIRSSQTVALPLADKRREPEGGWDSYQVNQRRLATWK